MNIYHHIITELSALIAQQLEPPQAGTADHFAAARAFVADKELLNNFEWLKDTSDRGTRGRQRTEACVDALTEHIEAAAHLWYQRRAGPAVNVVALSYLAVIHSQRRWNSPHHHDLNSALEVLADAQLDDDLRTVIARIVGLGHAVRACHSRNYNEVAGSACQLDFLMALMIGDEQGDNAKAIKASAIILAQCLEARHEGGRADHHPPQTVETAFHGETAYIVEHGTTFSKAVNHAVTTTTSARLVLVSATGFVGEDTHQRELFDVMPASNSRALSELYGCAIEVKGSRPKGSLRHLLTAKLERRPLRTIKGISYIPLPLVERCLNDLFRQRPDDFHTLVFEFIPAVPINWLPAIETIPVPKPALVADGGSLSATIKNAVENKDWTHPALVVARFAAATLSNVRTLLGPGALNIRPWRDARGVSETGALEWMQALNIIWGLNHEATFDSYFEQVSAPSELGNGRAAVSFGAGERVLVLEVGGTHIKYRLSDTHNTDKHGFSTAPDDERYTSAHAFAKRIRHEIFGNGTHAQPKLYAIIMTWPGAVHAPFTPKANPTGAAGILDLFGLSRTIRANTAREIRALGIREAIEKEFNCPVVLLNDGSAHAVAARPQDRDWRRLCALAAGTGTALGVLDRGTDIPQPVLAELGKAIVNIACPFPTHGNFPAGCANQLLSKNTMQLLGGGNAPCSPAELAYCLQRDEQSTAPLKALLASELSQQLAGLELPWITDVADLIMERRLDQLMGMREEAQRIIEKHAYLVADLSVLCLRSFRADMVSLTGGPFSGSIRDLIVPKIYQALHNTYGIKPRRRGEAVRPNTVRIVTEFIATEQALLETRAALLAEYRKASPQVIGP